MCTVKFQMYFWNKTLHVSDSSSVHHQDFFHCAHSNVLCHTACEQNLGVKLYMFRTVPLPIIRMRAGSGSRSQALSKICMTYSIAVCTAKNSWWWTEELSVTCRVLFKNKFEKLVHLVSFIIRIYQDARSPEGQMFSDHNWWSCDYMGPVLEKRNI